MENGMSNIYDKLEVLQQEFKAPKSEYNSHGGFKYRTLEKMLEALKPLMQKNNVTLMFSDDVVESGGRPHIKVTAKLIDLEDTKMSVENTAVAQEAEIQKGMQAAQISGSTSSYARKYALAGLLLVDDSDEIDKKEGDQTDWDGEIKSAKSLEQLMRVFNKMDASEKKNYTEALSARKAELADAAINQ